MADSDGPQNVVHELRMLDRLETHTRLQKWLSERTPILRYTYIACSVPIKLCYRAFHSFEHPIQL